MDQLKMRDDRAEDRAEEALNTVKNVAEAEAAFMWRQRLKAVIAREGFAPLAEDDRELVRAQRGDAVDEMGVRRSNRRGYYKQQGGAAASEHGGAAASKSAEAQTVSNASHSSERPD